VGFIFTTVKLNRLRCARYAPRLKHGVPAEYEKSNGNKQARRHKKQKGSQNINCGIGIGFD